jgi:hypothetical protein
MQKYAAIRQGRQSDFIHIPKELYVAPGELSAALTFTQTASYLLLMMIQSITSSGD